MTRRGVKNAPVMSVDHRPSRERREAVGDLVVEPAALLDRAPQRTGGETGDQDAGDEERRRPVAPQQPGRLALGAPARPRALAVGTSNPARRCSTWSTSRRSGRCREVTRHGGPNSRPSLASSRAVARPRERRRTVPARRCDEPRDRLTVRCPAMDSRLAAVLVFVASGSVLVLEILAGRLLAPYVGVSLETFTAIIGVVLAGIAIGTWLGGRLADRRDPRALLPVALTLGGAAAIAAVPIIRALGPSADGSNGRRRSSCWRRSPSSSRRPCSAPSRRWSSSCSCAPSTTPDGWSVGCRRSGRSARWSGCSAPGSSSSPSSRRLRWCSASAARSSLTGVGLWWAAAGGRGLRLDGRRRRDRRRARRRHDACWPATPCDVETAYFCASVRHDPERPSGRVLVLDDLRHAYVDLDDPTYLDFAYIQLLGDVVDALVRPGERPSTPCTSAAAGSRCRATWRRRGRAPTTWCSSSIRASSSWPRTSSGCSSSPRLRVRTGDARRHVAELPAESADLVIGDAFGGRAVPWHLATREFVGRDLAGAA